MRKLITPALSLILTLALTATSQAASVWKVSDGNNTLYLGGTLHILSPTDYPLPDAYKTAYSAADMLVFETDIGALNSPEFAQQSMQLLTYAGQGSLADDISEDTMNMLTDHLQQRGVPFEHFNKLKPAMVGVTLSMIEFQRMGLTSQGVDNYYYTLAMGDGKSMDWFETPQQQLQFIASLGKGEEDAYIQYTIQDVEKMPAMIDQMKDDWRAGDMASMYEANMKELLETYPDIYNDLLTERNQNWMPKLKSMMASPETEFVLVGTLHMPGDTGVLKLLEQQGYSIQQLQ